MILRRKSESVPKYQIKRANKDSAIRKATIGCIEVVMDFITAGKQGREIYRFLVEKQPYSGDLSFS